jgi:hypothetical protein
MTLAEVRVALRDASAKLEGDDPDVPVDECAYLGSVAMPHGLGLMFRKNRVVQVDVSSANFQTASGAQVGDTEEKIKALYPERITVEPHPYDPDGHYLIYSPSEKSDRGFGMVFETDGKKVTMFRTGTQPAIALIEGCQ